MQRVRPAWTRIALPIMLVMISLSSTLAEDIDHPALSSHLQMLDRLTVTPGSSGSVAAGLINPAVWGTSSGNGSYMDFYNPVADAAGAGETTDLLGVSKLGPLGFGVNYRDYDFVNGPGHTNYLYTLGLGFGNRSGGLGLSYSWSKGGHNLFEPRELINLGMIVRRSFCSFGSSMSYDFESENTIWQMDLGFRPFGPRLTLFGGASYIGAGDYGIPGTDDEYDKYAGNFGIDAKLLPGLSVAAGMRDTGELSLALNVSFGGGNDGRVPVMKIGARYHADDEQMHSGSTVSYEATTDNSVFRFLARPNAYPEITLAGDRPYRTFRFFDDRTTFLSTMEMLSAMASDAGVGGVLINMSGASMSPAKYWELRAQLAGFRAAGKKVIIYFDRVGMFDYMLTSIADEIWMDPWGDLDVSGLAFGMTYFSDLLDKMGVGFQEFRHFRYKSAMESFSRMEMSDGQREQLEVLFGDWFEELVKITCETRGLTRAQWDELMNEKQYLIPEEALAAGLVDKIGDFHDARAAVQDAERRTTPDRAVANIANFGGDPLWSGDEWGEPQRIAVLYAIGPCAMDDGIRGRQLSRVIRALRENPAVKAIVLRSDSPGGDPLPSDLVSRELKLTREVKPVVISQGMVAASGGYWISMHSDKILASPVTITGSIGVIGGHFYDNGLSDKVGMNYQGLKFGEHSDLYRGASIPFIGIGLPHRPANDAEIERAKVSMMDLYDKFIASVAEGRGMSVEEVAEVAQGRVWTGNQGLENGLVDEIGGLWDSIHKACELAGIGPDERVELVQGPGIGLFPTPDFLPDLPGLSLSRLFGVDQVEEPENLLSGGLWDSLDDNERIYIEQMLLNPGKPVLVMDPITVQGASLNP
ncbi:MAG: hypothetical protein GY835_13150 [bacterium]|nr:hypothetical protein [bacterium]